jgi:hypothetical protein
MQPANPNFRSKSSGGRTILIIGIALITLISLLGGALIYFFPFTHASNPTNSQTCTADSPYGFTTINADAQLVKVYKQLNVCWVRYQYHWGKQGKKPGIETDPGVYTWGPVDAAITAMNAANIHVDFAIQAAPSWHLSQMCKGTLFLPGPNDIAQFATMIATRYDGNHGHGRIDAFEIGNEEYDTYSLPGDPTNSLQCRSASYYGPVLKAAYQAIKAVNPHVLVGMFGMAYRNVQHINDFVTYLYAQGYGPYMDYMNYHYYNNGGDPTVTANNLASFDLWWQTMHDIATKYGFASKPIWVTETGWPTKAGYQVNHIVTPQAQAQYLQYILGEAAKSHVIQKVFWFTINYGNESDSIYPPSGPLPAFDTLQKLVQQQPAWK